MKTEKLATILIVLFLLVGLPLSSYLYLRKGMNFRLDAIEELTVKSHLPKEASGAGSENVHIFYSEIEAQLPLVDSVRIHFRDHPMLQFTSFSQEQGPLNDSLVQAHKRCDVPGTYSDYIFLVNRQDAIVNCYNPDNLVEVKKLINNIAFLLPPEPEKDFDFPTQQRKIMEENQILEKKLNRWAWVLSAIVFLLVVSMRKINISSSIDFTFLPAVYSTLNFITFLLLLQASIFIRYGKNMKVHRSFMMAALVSSVLFLLGYVLYHITTPETLFCQEGNIRYIYFFLLITHIVLAAVILPFILFTFIRAYTGQYARHKKMARWVYPLWLYVAATGPVLYLMLSPCYGG